jgi:GntR family transcriptional regulator/MocR family aminotransferase
MMQASIVFTIVANWYAYQIQFACCGEYQLASYFLDSDSSEPLFEQLYRQVRDDVLAGRLPPGEKLPSSRRWADHLGVSRTTVLTALDQLRSEGYIESRQASVVRVTRKLPEDSLRHLPAQPVPAKPTPAHHARATWPQPRNFGTPRAFQMNAPALDRFPCRDWARLAAGIWRQPPLDLLNYPRPGGYLPLRQAIAGYLASERGVACDAGQVVVTAGSQQALNLAAQVLLRPRGEVWMENPGYYAARLAFESVGASVHSVPVDEQGINVDAGLRKAPRASLAYVTPSHQCPLGCRLSLERRLALLRWAEASGAWIVEDEYDSAFRYAGRPLAPLHALDDGRRVLYVGSFSLMLYPALRIGFVVVPPALVDAFLSARALADWNSPAVDQAVLAKFIDGGMLTRHLRRMRMLYAERQQTLLRESRKLERWVRIESRPAGLHVAGWLNGIAEADIMQRARFSGVELRPMSMYQVGRVPRPAVLFGFAPFDEPAAREAVARLRHYLPTT